MTSYVDLFNETDFTGNNITTDTLTVNTSLTLAYTHDAILTVDSAGSVSSTPLTNGQLLIGRTGLTPTPASLTGTANRVIVTPASGSIMLSTPQDIATTSSPSFANMTIATDLDVMTGIVRAGTVSCYNFVAAIATAGDLIADNYFLCRGTMSCGTHSMTCGSLSSTSISTGAIGSTNITCETVLAAGTISCGTASMTCGALSSSSITSSGSIICTSLSTTSTTNQLTLGDSYANRVTINSVAPSSTSLIYTIPDTIINSSFIMSQGVQTFNGQMSFGLAPQIFPVTNQLILGGLAGVRKVTINAPTPATASRTHTIPDVGADANFAMTEGAQTMNGVKTFGSGILLPTTGGTATSMDYYEAFTHTTSWNGAFGASSISGDVIYTRVGRMVTAMFPVILGTCTATQVMWQITNTPTRFRPPSDLYITCASIQVGAGPILSAIGVIYISSTGNNQIHNGVGGGTFNSAGSPTVGLYRAVSVSYSV